MPECKIDLSNRILEIKRKKAVRNRAEVFGRRSPLNLSQASNQGRSLAYKNGDWIGHAYREAEIIPTTQPEVSQLYK